MNVAMLPKKESVYHGENVEMEEKTCGLLMPSQKWSCRFNGESLDLGSAATMNEGAVTTSPDHS